MQTVADALTPRLLLHGHLHLRYTHEMGPTTVHGLDCDRKPSAAMLVLELGGPQVRAR